MAKKKPTPEPPKELKELEAKVDAMMDPRPQAKTQSTADVAMSPDDLKQQIAANIGLPQDKEDTAPETKITIQSVATPLATTAPELPGAASKSKAKQSKPAQTIDPKPDEPKIAPEPSLPDPEPSDSVAEQADTDTESAPEPPTDIEPKIELEGADLDAAVDDIVVEEADTVLAVEDARRGHKVRQAETAAKPKHPVASALWTALLIVLLIGIIASLVAVVLYGS